MRPIHFAITLALACALSLAAAGVTAAADEAAADSTCYKCHKELQAIFSKGTVHEPVSEGDCSSCHEEHGDKNSLVLTDEVPQLCYNCHDEYKGETKHEPVAEGSCLDCHNVHRSDYDGLLVKVPSVLCQDCHDAPAGASVHEPAADGSCLDCHTAHDSPEAGLLTKDSASLCAECHEGSDHSKGNNPHEPVAGGECSECHKPHQSDRKFLLAADYSQERYLAYSDKAYTLCYNCHEKTPFEDKTASDQTEFRNGEVNLHHLHVAGRDEKNKYGITVKKDGMTCLGCHLTHGTSQAKLIRENLECGATFCYTMNYRKFEGGGTCVVGCHKPKVYRHNPQAVTEGNSLKEATPVAQQGGTSGGAVAP